MGSVLALESFKDDFGLPKGKTGFASAKNAAISSNVVSLLTAGCFFGAIAASFINEKFGRRPTLMAFSVIFLIGAAVQTAATHAIGQIYAGRVVAGLGIGGMSAVMSVYVSENAPPKHRGRIAGLFQEFLVIGSTFAYWLDYGVALRIPVSTKQWRVPVAIQIIPGGLMLIGLCFLKESPRWLAKNGRHQQATESLAWSRCSHSTDPEVLEEMAEIRASIEEELNATEGLSWKECLQPGNRKRFILAFVVMTAQQFSGTNSIGYCKLLSLLQADGVPRRANLHIRRRPSNLSNRRCQQSKLLPLRHRSLRDCQGHHHRHLPARRHRPTRTQEGSHGRRLLDGRHDDHHRRRP